MRSGPDFFLDLEQMAKVRAGAAQAVFKGCNEPDERSQLSHKASNEDNHHSLTPKQILRDLGSCFGQSDVGAVAKQQRISVPIADHAF
jgi:hypothetical protein